MSMYQFLIAVRSQDGSQLTNADGQTTSYVALVLCALTGAPGAIFVVE